MHRHYRKSRRGRVFRAASKFFSSLALVLVGSAGFYLAAQWFRRDAEDAPVLAQETPVVNDVTSTADPVSMVNTGLTGSVSEQPSLQIEESSAPLVSAFDGQHTGRVQSYLTKNAADMIVLAYLPALDMAADSYHVWLLKEGLADVKDMGQLAPRADGSWVLNFTAGPATGIVDPRDYRSIVIMREPNDDNPAPSGYKIAEAEL